jgi:hypothetical protein
VLDALVIDPITVNIQVGWNEINGSALGTSDLARGGDSPGVDLSYSQLVADLAAHAADPAAQQELAALPANAASQLPASLFVTTAQEKAWGLIAPNAAGTDGSVGFSANYPYSFDPNNQDVAGEIGFIGVAEHEITHAMGRLVGNGAFALTNYTAAGALNTSGGGGYYSLDGGVTNLGNFAPAGQDPADWAAQDGDAFDAVTVSGAGGALTQADASLLGTLGFNEAPTPFQVANETTGSAGMQNGTPDSGAAAGLSQQPILTGANACNGTAYAPKAFIHLSGSDANEIDASPAGGNNALDGSAGGNFLNGGAGNDAFYLDDRSSTANTWSSLINFHAADQATIPGVTLADFGLTWLHGQGASGKPQAAVTLADDGTADLNNGRLSIACGTTPDQPGLPASPYMNVAAM